MHLFLEFVPVILFFVAYRVYGIFVATAVLMGASLVQIGIQRAQGKKPSRMQLVSLGLILVFGGVTILFQNEEYLKWKVTLVNWLFAIAFFGSHVVGRRTLIERMLGEQLKAPAEALRKVNLSWAVFFMAVGALNAYVVTSFSTETWVNFKLFGLLGLTFAFTIAQGVYLSRKMPR